MSYEILDRKRRAILPNFKSFKNDFYLAGGTAFAGHDLKKTQEEKNTLSVLIDKDIRCSFFTYPYPLLKKPTDEENLKIASMEDIACMKLSAITGRASNKDYIDLYFILKTLPLRKIFAFAEKKLPDLDLNLLMKSLVYFEDIQDQPILYKKGHKVSFKKIKESLKSAVKKAQNL